MSHRLAFLRYQCIVELAIVPEDITATYLVFTHASNRSQVRGTCTTCQVRRCEEVWRFLCLIKYMFLAQLCIAIIKTKERGPVQILCAGYGPSKISSRLSSSLTFLLFTLYLQPPARRGSEHKEKDLPFAILQTPELLAPPYVSSPTLLTFELLGGYRYASWEKLLPERWCWIKAWERTDKRIRTEAKMSFHTKNASKNKARKKWWRVMGHTLPYIYPNTLGQHCSRWKAQVSRMLAALYQLSYVWKCA